MNGRNQLTVMGTTQTSAAPPRGPAWSHPAPGEPRWPASLAVLAILVLYALLPERLTVGPTWIVPALALALLVPLSLAAPHRRPNEPAWARLAALALIALVNLANLGSLILLVQALLQGRTLVGGIHLVGPTLLLSSLAIWLTNVLVFALWYGELDRGGPDDRARPQHRHPDFLFPQMTTPGCADARWTPSFIDYTYVAFTNATAFSPTDTMPLTPWAKALMTVQSLASLLTVALVAARAVNILGS